MKDFNYTQFGRYVLLEPIARGGMGQVYLSLVGKTGWEKFCAIKKILPQSGSPETLLRFKSEAEINLKLNHSNLISVFDVGIIGQEAYMAMELVEGDNLRSIWNRCAIERKAFPLHVALFIIKEAAKGLEYAHSFEGLSLVHRDISPPNIMVTYSGEVKILDFGLAISSFSKRFTKPGIVYGKMPYLSPEQARGEELTSKTDIYSLGIILWELLTGKRLFPLKNDKNIIKELKKRGSSSSIQLPSVISGRGDGNLDEILLKMLAFNPKDRPTASEVSKMISQYLSAIYPGTENSEVSAFMDLLFRKDRQKCKEKRRNLLETYRQKANETQNDLEIEEGSIVADRYIIKKLIGEGGMGKVFEAEHKNIGKKVAIKILEPKGGMNPDEAGKRFEREAKAASRIEHPSVVEVLDYGFTNGTKPFLVMEYLKGKNVGDLLAGKSLDLQTICDLGAQLAYGLNAAHEAGLIHRDVKPDNIFIVKNHKNKDVLKIIDFGIAKSFSTLEEDLTRPGITLGTPEYIAPELLIGEKPTIAADIYSFGAVLYEFLGGKPPYTGSDTENIIRKKLKEQRKPVSEIRPDAPPILQAIVESCLAQDPLVRPRSLKVIAEQLEQLWDEFNEYPKKIIKETNHKLSQQKRISSNAPHKGTIRMMPSEQGAGSWMPLIIAFLGVSIFVVGIVKAGKYSNIQLNSFEPYNEISEIKLSPQKTMLATTDVVLENKIYNKKTINIITNHKSSDLKNNKLVLKRKNYKHTTSKAKILLKKAKTAFAQQNYPAAFELSHRAMNQGGGVSAKKLYEKTGKILGLK